MLIQTERLRIRPFEISDAEWYFKVTRDKDIKRYLPCAGLVSIKDSVNVIRKYYSRGDFVHDFYLVLEDKESYEQLGALVITQNLDKSLDVAMLVAKEHRGKGYIIEAIKGVVQHLPHGSVLEFTIDRRNESSLMAVQKLDKIMEVTSSRSEDITEYYRIFILEV